MNLTNAAMVMALLLGTQFSHAEMVAVPADQLASYKQAISASLRSFDTNYSCTDTHKGVIPSNDGEAIPSIVEFANEVYIDNSGAQPAIMMRINFSSSYVSYSGSEASLYTLTAATSADYKSITAIKLETQKKVKLNNGTLIAPQIVDGYETLKSIECVKK